MHESEPIDRYFTEQVVGRPFTVDMGPSDGTCGLPARGVRVEWLSGAAHLTAVAGRSLWAADPADAVLGQPLNLPGLARWRLGLLAGAWLLWSLLLGGLLLWWRR